MSRPPEPFEPDWYLRRLSDLRQLSEELRPDPRLTGNHPMDWFLAITFVLVLALLLFGVFE